MIAHIPATSTMLGELTRLWGHTRLQAEITAAYRLHKQPRMEIVHKLWAANCKPTIQEGI